MSYISKVNRVKQIIYEISWLIFLFVCVFSVLHSLFIDRFKYSELLLEFSQHYITGWIHFTQHKKKGQVLYGWEHVIRSRRRFNCTMCFFFIWYYSLWRNFLILISGMNIVQHWEGVWHTSDFERIKSALWDLHMS